MMLPENFQFIQIQNGWLAAISDFNVCIIWKAVPDS